MNFHIPTQRRCWHWSDVRFIMMLRFKRGLDSPYLMKQTIRERSDSVVKLLNITSKSQHDTDIDERFRPSACGPVTAYVMMEYHFSNAHRYTVNDLYRLLGSTKIGLFTWRFIRNMRKLLGPDWAIERCSIEEVMRQLDQGHPVAAKFDKWFTFRWRGKYEFDYHWVPIVGYEVINADLMLLIHDNGGKNRPSQLRRVSFKKNKPILTFVKMEKNKK